MELMSKIDNINKRKFNSDLKKWNLNLEKALQLRVKSLSIRGKQRLLKKLTGDKAIKNLRERYNTEGHLLSGIKVRYKRSKGLISKMSVVFPVQGFFVLTGTGRGHKVDNSRDAKDWINPVLNAHTEELASIIVKHLADESLNAISVSQYQDTSRLSFMEDITE
jgi:hypothetical protein